MANIAIVFPAYAGGGAENVAITVGDMLMSRYGHKIHIWASRMAPGFEDSLSAKGYQVENFARSFKARIHEPRTSRHIADLVHSHDIDVLIISVNAVGCMRLGAPTNFAVAFRHDAKSCSISTARRCGSYRTHLPKEPSQRANR